MSEKILVLGLMCCAIFERLKVDELHNEKKMYKKHAKSLKYVKEQTPELCLEAVKSVGYSLEYVIHQTPEICIEAVKNWAGALQQVKKQTPEICLAAVKQDRRSLKYVKKYYRKLFSSC